MLVERDIQVLAEKKEYSQIFNYFHAEYTDMLKGFLQRHDIEIKDTDCLINYIYKTRTFMPKYNQYTIPITNGMYNENVPEDMKIALLLNSYRIVKKAFSE
ncbi:MAG: hypothetical protein IKM97_04490 [Clostridia bacterium]|nr:hypothetical protein [Clostridia bacterium]